MQNDLKIGFIGGGNMARALIGGLVKGLTQARNIHVVDVSLASLQQLENDFGVTTAQRIGAALETVDVLVLAVKPQQLRDVIAALQPHLRDQLLLSIAAGIRTTDISRWLQGYGQIVRSMPNTPALIGLGMTALYALPGVSDERRQMAEAIMQAVGQTMWLQDESHIDAVTAVSGSGPAYVFYFIEAMQQAALELGLTAQQGKQLAIATFTGASQLAATSSEEIKLLRERVTSKGGTTYAALCSMEQDELWQGIIRAVKAAAHRGKELGDEFGQQG